MIYSNKLVVVLALMSTLAPAFASGDDLVRSGGEAVSDLPTIAAGGVGGHPFFVAPLEMETGTDKVNLPWIADVTVTFSDVGWVANESYGYNSARGLALGLITGSSADATLTVTSWPAGEDPPPTVLKSVQFIADNAAGELQEPADIDAANVAKANAVIQECRQSALLAVSRPGKYELIIRTALRSLTNAPPGSPSWPRYVAYISEEYFACSLKRL